MKRYCPECDTVMKKMGSFATVKPEGQPSQKDDGTRNYRCTNERCTQYNKPIKINIDK